MCHFLSLGINSLAQSGRQSGRCPGIKEVGNAYLLFNDCGAILLVL